VTEALVHSRPAASTWFENWRGRALLKFFEGLSYAFTKNSIYLKSLCLSILVYTQISFLLYTQICLFLQSHHFGKFSGIVFLYIMQYNTISWTPRDPLRPITTPPPQNLGGCDTPTPRIDAYAQSSEASSRTLEAWIHRVL